ncbi:MAG: hypothetical protein OXE93_03480 [bacterium]|nr:hypothetical protein [bacterium]MCY4163263.1 hypothetical protein [bacterium]MCY4258200.1 hypothetical protein [bacterium]
MRLLRRSLVAVGGATAIAAILRMRGASDTPCKSGGWRPLDNTGNK